MTTADVFRDELSRLRARPLGARRRPLLTTLALLVARVVAAVPSARTALLSISGFGCLVAAAWSVSMTAGLAAAGLSLLLVEYLLQEGPRR